MKFKKKPITSAQIYIRLHDFWQELSAGSLGYGQTLPLTELTLDRARVSALPEIRMYRLKQSDN